MTHEQLMRHALDAAAVSPDPSTQNGALLADDLGRPLWDTVACNEFPDGVHYREERWERPGKYQWIEHAERNSIYAAAKNGIRTEGLVLIAGWAACADCARGCIQAALSEVVTLRPQIEDTNGRWDDSIAIAFTMLEEAGVRLTFLDPKPFADIRLRRNGVIWSPC